MKNLLKQIGKNTVTVIGITFLILGILGVIITLIIAAYEFHWFLGSILGGFACMAIGLFLINILDEFR